MIDDCEPWTFYNESDRRARKTHRCCECHRTIEPGETYKHIVGKQDSDWSAFNTCAHCQSVTRWLSFACEGWIIGLAEEDLGNHITGDEKEVRSLPLVRLARWMGADWRDRAGNLRDPALADVLAADAIERFKKLAYA